MNFIADDMKAIQDRMREIRKESGLPDDNWQTACGVALDAIAGTYDLVRRDYEADYSLRNRIGDARSRRFK